MLPAALDAFAAQVDVPANSFDAIVFANSCRDDTANVAKAFARAHPEFAIHVVEGELPRGSAHIGAARGAVMDAACARFARDGRPSGIVATTDADSVVDARWVRATLDAMGRADAVTGRVTLLPGELEALPSAIRAGYLLDDAYRAVVADLEAMRDPVDDDPLPRHAHHFGASFAVTARAYRRAGGLPRLPRMEDIALYGALRRIDARVRHAPEVTVATSARTIARVDGGLATRLAAYASARANDVFGGADVEVPRYTIARIDARASLRRMWNGSNRADDRARVLSTYGISEGVFLRLFDSSSTFGENAWRLEEHGDAAFRNPERVSMAVALAELERVRAVGVAGVTGSPCR